MKNFIFILAMVWSGLAFGQVISIPPGNVSNVVRTSGICYVSSTPTWSVSVDPKQCRIAYNMATNEIWWWEQDKVSAGVGAWVVKGEVARITGSGAPSYTPTNLNEVVVNGVGSMYGWNSVTSSWTTVGGNIIETAVQTPFTPISASSTTIGTAATETQTAVANALTGIKRDRDSIAVHRIELNALEAISHPLQTLSIVGNTISLSSGGGSVNVPAYTGASPIVVTGQVISHATSGVTAGAYGSSTQIPVITFDNKGHATSASTVAVMGEATTFTNTATIQNDGTLPNISPSVKDASITPAKLDRTYIESIPATTNSLVVLSSTITSTVNGVAASFSPVSGTIVESLGFNAGGFMVKSTAIGGTNLSFSGTSSPVTLNSSTGTDVTITAGGINTLSASSGDITITGTEAQTLSRNTANNIVTISTTGSTANIEDVMDVREYTTTAGGTTVTVAAPFPTDLGKWRIIRNIAEQNRGAGKGVDNVNTTTGVVTFTRAFLANENIFIKFPKQ